MSIGTCSFNSFGETGANQGTSVPTHVTKDYEIREKKSSSSSVGPNIWKIQRPLSNLFLRRLKPILRRIKRRIRFSASVKFWF